MFRSGLGCGLSPWFILSFALTVVELVTKVAWVTGSGYVSRLCVRLCLG